MSMERRLHPRAAVSLPVEIRAAGKGPWEKALLRDLSAGGAGVLTRVALPVQSEVEFRIQLPEEGGDREKWIEILCLVVRTGPPAQLRPGFSHFAGLHFLTLHGDDFERVRTFIWDRLHHSE